VILDTNALSAYADGVPAAVAIVDAAASIEVPVIALGEYRFGVTHSRNRRDYEAWLTKFLGLSRVLNVTEETSESYANIRSELKHAGTPIPSNDLWIAALSRQHGMPVLSRDRHFDLVKGFRRVAW
jgi:tRNA(fMet)-specific endonuclease VapC